MSAFLDAQTPGGYTGDAVLPGDASTPWMQPYMPPVAQSQGLSPWESLAMYGITRAIDNRFAPEPMLGNTAPGYFTGQNGQTYMQGRPGQMAPTMQAPIASIAGFQLSPLMLLLIGGGIYLATRD